MSSKRGRKRNDNLPPNRARDVQRAFRARRAAHLQALEQRVMELEEENTCFRHALHLPAANRPALGKGPTGKDKPKGYEEMTSHALLSSHDSSSGDSPNSIRTSSLSPETKPVVVLPRALHTLDGVNWDQSMLLSGEPQSDIPDSPFRMPTPIPSKIHAFNSFSHPPPPGTRPLSMEMTVPHSNYSHASQLPSRSYGPSLLNMTGDREEYMPMNHERDSPLSRQNTMAYYSDSGYESQDVNMHHRINSPSLGQISIHSHPRPASTLPYIHRRPMGNGIMDSPNFTSFRHEMPHSTQNAQLHGNHHIRLPSPPDIPESRSTSSSRPYQTHS